MIASATSAVHAAVGPPIGRAARAGILALAGVLTAGCAGEAGAPLVVGVPTTVQDSGLLDSLLPAFEAAHPEYRVRIVAAGSGELLALAARGDLDAAISHAPQAEKEFMADGSGTLDREFMENDFVIVGPREDPAGIRGTADPIVALARIAESGAPFLSRGDRSGTHGKEMELRGAGGLPAAGAAYREAGQGMGDVLLAASDLGAYTLSDRATYLNLRDGLELDVLVEGDPRLRNVYSVLVSAAARNPDGAMALADWLSAEAGRRRIADYGAGEFDRRLFEPIGDG